MQNLCIYLPYNSIFIQGIYGIKRLIYQHRQFMEREELRNMIDESLESSQTTLTLSDETINGELDDELEGVTDDAQVDDNFVNRIVKRLTRMDGNLHKDVSTQVNIWKKSHPSGRKPASVQKSKDDDGGEGESEELRLLKSLSTRMEAIERQRKAEAEKNAKDAVFGKVEADLKAKFDKAGIEVNRYVFRQTLRDLEIPEVKDGGKPDTNALVKEMERNYYKNLKEAGFDGKGTPRRGSTAAQTGKSVADRFFSRKAKREGWEKS